MRPIYNACLLFIVSLFLVQCQKDVSYTGTTNPVIVLPDPVTATIQGNVYDETGQVAAGVSIKIGSKTATTDANGYFRISQVSVDKNAALVVAEKTGYFKALRSFVATSGTNQVTIKLIKRDLAGSVNGASGGEATLSNGTKIGLKPNGVVNAATGAEYTGAIKVYASYIDPTTNDIVQRVPGSFMADDKTGSRVTLASYGMVAVELEGASGEKLQIKTGSTATVTAPIPASLQASAPASMPTWYLDEAKGIWKEEGTGTKSGNFYTTEVQHFSFWNFDINIPAITLTVVVKDHDGAPMVHTGVTITRNINTSFYTTGGITDTLGQVSGLVPKNETLLLKIYDNCYNVVYSQTIGPFAQNTTLGTITIPANTPSFNTIKGKLFTCAGTGAIKGTIIMKIGNVVRYLSTDTAGNYQATVFTCGSTGSNVDIIGVDQAAQQQSTAQTFTLTPPLTNIPNITACGTNATEYINYTLDGTSFSISSAVADSMSYFTSNQGATNYTTYMNGSHFGGSGITHQIYFNFAHTAPANGTYAMTQFNANLLAASNPSSISVTVTNFPQAIGEYIVGTFSGTYTTQQPVGTHTVSGNFRMRKNF